MAKGMPKTLANMRPAAVGRQGPVKQAPAQADLAGGATLADVITNHNTLLANLRAAGVVSQ